MEGNFTLSTAYKTFARALVLIGIVTLGFGFYFENDKTWANFLLNNYYFISLAVGATFFLAIQYITQSGWSAQFIRIPHAMGTYIPLSGFLFIFLIFGMNSIYHWSLPDAAQDPLIDHKSPYLNIPFFFIRIVVFFGLWILMTNLMRKTSLKEDYHGGFQYFHKSELYSKIYIFILAFTFSLITFDLIMSIDVHWFSTLFAAKNFIAAFCHAVAIITLITILLNGKGYLSNLNKSHLHDFSRYIYMLSIIWAYLWFIQYLLIWFANIHEETIYYVIRTNGKWRIFFFLNIILNGAIPFLALVSKKLDSNKFVLLFVCAILIIGQWVDLYIQIMPGSVGKFHIGWIEIGTFIGFAGAFILVVARGLGRAPLIPRNHPYLEESMNHHLH